MGFITWKIVMIARCRWWVGTAVVGGLLGLASCGPAEEPAPSCVTLNTNCLALYDPATYSKIFPMTFQQTCATGIGTCHTSDARMGGLIFENADDGYEMLFGTRDGRTRIDATNPGCGTLAKRVVNKEMPPGKGLSDPELCVVVKWLADGAPKN